MNRDSWNFPVVILFSVHFAPKQNLRLFIDKAITNNVTQAGMFLPGFYLCKIFTKQFQNDYFISVTSFFQRIARHQQFKVRTRLFCKYSYLLNFNYANDVQLFSKYFFFVIFQKQSPEVFYKKDVLKNFGKFTGMHFHKNK